MDGSGYPVCVGCGHVVNMLIKLDGLKGEYMSEPKDYLGKIITFLGHKLKVTKVVEKELGYNKIHLSCAVHCCTNPCYVNMEMTTETFEELISFLETWKKMDRLIRRGTPL